MRTNIDIDEKLMKLAMKAAGTTTKRETVEKALELLVRIDGQTAIRKLRGKLQWEGDLDAMRRNESSFSVVWPGHRTGSGGQLPAVAAQGDYHTRYY